MMEYLSLKQITEKYPFTMGQLRDCLRRKRTGLKDISRKIGRRIYIRNDHFEEWIEGFKIVVDQVMEIPE